MAEATIQIDLERVVAAVSFGKPCPGIGDGCIRLRCSRRDVERTTWDWRIRERSREIGRIRTRAGGCGADGRDRRIAIDADELMIAMGSDVPQRERRVRS